MRLNKFLIAFLFVCVGMGLKAQDAMVKGFLYSKESGEPVLFTYVYLEGTEYGIRTNEEGYFSISKVPPGEYNLIVNDISYEKHKEKITLKAGDIKTVKILLKTANKLKEHEVSARKQEAQTEVRMSVTPATKKDIQAVPVVGGTKDIVNYITAAVPGAITTGDQGGQVYIRGGSPIQNKVLLDGMIIYNPFHSIGFFSVFDTDIIKTADIYTGGFNAEYGGRISSIMDIKTRDGNKNKISGKVEANPFMAKGLVEGPLFNNFDDGGGSASYILSAKTSYLEQSSKVFYPYVNDDTTATGQDTTIGLPFNFTDLYGKISFNGSNGSKFNIFGFNFRDQVKYQAISDLNWNSWGVGSNFVLVPSSSPVLIEGNFSFSDYRIELQEEELEPRFSEVNGFNFGFDFTYFLGKNQAKYGVMLQGFKTNFETFNSVGRRIRQEDFTTEIAGYFLYRMVKNRWVIEPSMRLHYYVSLSTISPEPRLGIKYNINENLRVKGAAGIYSQNLISAVSDRDVVNLFYGFLSGPDNLQEEFVREDGTVKELTHPLQKANHYILGLEYDLSDKINVNVEGYIKDFTQLTNINRNKIFDESDFDKPDVLKKDFLVETGLARGVDFTLKYNDKRAYFWVVYSLSKVDRWDGFQTYFPVFDRRHNVNLVGTYMLGKDKTWEINARWNYGSGFPFTQTAGFYQGEGFSDGIGTDYTMTNGELETVYGDLNAGRLPDYHRFDFTVTKNFIFYEETGEGEEMKRREKSKMQILAGVTNLYSRNNVFYVNRVTSEVVRQLPILPSLGFTWEF